MPLAVSVVAPGPEELRKRRISGRHRWYAGALVGLSFLLIAMIQAATSGGSVASVVAFEVLAVVFGVCYLLLPVRVAGGFAETHGGWWGKVGALAVMVAITVPMIVIGGAGVTGLWIYIGVAAAIMFPLAWSVAIAVGLAVAMLILAAGAGGSLPWQLALTLVALTLWMAGFAGNIRLTIELRETRDELARAAVAAERARIGRDLHDILGHSLTAIAVKAGLARRLLDRSRDGAAGDTASAATEIGDVERLAREALSDVRATAAGYRDVSLAGELAVARSVLTAAGIHAELPTAVDDVQPSGREVFGFVVREAVTNVLRHSGASRCNIELTRASVQITDDGRGPARGGARVMGADLPGVARSDGDVRGGGLRGLAERVQATGGTLTAGPLAGGGFRVLATVPDHGGPAGRDPGRTR
jgi:two-component system sensor histidine kinase DesK